MWLLDNSLTLLKLPFVLCAKRGDCVVFGTKWSGCVKSRGAPTSREQRRDAVEGSTALGPRSHWLHLESSGISPACVKPGSQAQTRAGVCPEVLWWCNAKFPSTNSWSSWLYLECELITGFKVRKIWLESLLFIHLINDLGDPYKGRSQSSSVKWVQPFFVSGQLLWQKDKVITAKVLCRYHDNRRMQDMFWVQLLKNELCDGENEKILFKNLFSF